MVKNKFQIKLDFMFVAMLVVKPAGCSSENVYKFYEDFLWKWKQNNGFHFVSDNLMMVWMRKLNVSSHKLKTIKFTLNRQFQQSLKCQCQSRFINSAKMLKILCSFYLEFIILPKNEQIILHSKRESFTATKRKHVQRLLRHQLTP